jgi:glutamine amidotransferase
LKALYSDDERLHDFGEESRVVVSEPLGELPGVWNEVPESSWGVVQLGQDELHRFRPAVPALA